MKTVLIIDDDKSLCALMKKCVEKENLYAMSAYTGVDGLKYLRETDDCALVILDVMMPELDGFQVLKKNPRKVH